MKRVFLPFALLALLSAASCTKDGNYDRTQLTLTTSVSENYLNLFDVMVEGRNFDGSDISMAIASGDHSYTFETEAREGETTIRVYSRIKNPLPEIDTAITYDMNANVKGTIRAKVKGGEQSMSFKSFDCSGGKKSAKISGKKLESDMSTLSRITFDKSFTFSISKYWKSIIVDLEEISNN